MKPDGDLARGPVVADTLDDRDGTADAAVNCGDGTDVAKLDLHDPGPADASACETITREAVKEAPMVSIVAAHRTHTGVRVELSCPHDDDRACSGRLDDGGGAVPYAIARGHRGVVALGGLARPSCTSARSSGASSA